MLLPSPQPDSATDLSAISSTAANFSTSIISGLSFLQNPRLSSNACVFKAITPSRTWSATFTVAVYHLTCAFCATVSNIRIRFITTLFHLGSARWTILQLLQITVTTKQPLIDYLPDPTLEQLSSQVASSVALLCTTLVILSLMLPRDCRMRHGYRDIGSRLEGPICMLTPCTNVALPVARLNTRQRNFTLETDSIPDSR